MQISAFSMLELSTAYDFQSLSVIFLIRVNNTRIQEKFHPKVTSDTLVWCSRIRVSPKAPE